MADLGPLRTSPDPCTRNDDDNPTTHGDSTSLPHQEAPHRSPRVPEEQSQPPEPTPAPHPVPKFEAPGFFTLVTNTRFGAALAGARQSTRHPRVHYIFADDDPATLTAALADAHDSDANQQAHPPSPSASTSAPEGEPRRPRNHAILVDVVPNTVEGEDKAAAASATAGGDGGGVLTAGSQWRVASALSLSPDFAVTEARITRMEESSSAGSKTGGPSGGANPGRQKEEEGEEGVSNGGALMLKIEGVELAEDEAVAAGPRDPGASLPGSASLGKDGPDAKEDYASLMDEFDKQMSILRKVKAAGEQWVRAAEENPSGGGWEVQLRLTSDNDEEDQAERKDP
ncbi:hypothetical protein ACRALDRAFT_2026933 [Sodiomyces alcalophilus JCM 7366]|uniref:uncharacterized protein n=1 Tax=Sodiomyces alcalophilus JCM 7366 TaxID=591952 RepID=UPI0039B4B6E8